MATLAAAARFASPTLIGAGWLLAEVRLTTVAIVVVSVGGLCGYVGLWLGNKANRRLDVIADAQEREIHARLADGGLASSPGDGGDG